MRPFDMVETECRGMPAMDGTAGEAAPAGCHGWRVTKHGAHTPAAGVAVARREAADEDAAAAP